ncbi:uncharacterized protein Z519_01304 [Cladophialophora bantiana CBS 173.52]|uniref:HRQ family protein 2 n=1 Tax=Cladophialophora bantiana (strain ATCC 10958 / CBS 173.52 / CDC B-1940 / NIH 8579) TaxID=1442370 RepID=A0A0D2I3D1_CLAB1|nr:uncharacterized protein Z519_01304 [Cladophialophora bantiana CBS 173.52]KIW97720.1 hypothetical protein Z519_01304 [Cladophialophora bantiana CBS 173.52]
MSSFQNIEKPSLVWHWRSWDDIKAASMFTLGNYANIILLAIFLILAINQVRLKNLNHPWSSRTASLTSPQQAAKKVGFENRYLKAPEFPPIEEQPDFDWEATEPLRFRPFKPKYHLTMGEFALHPAVGVPLFSQAKSLLLFLQEEADSTRAESDKSALENLDPSELLVMDRNYADRIAYRRKVMAEHGEHVVAVNDDYRIRPAVVELYQFLLGTYLPLRFPKMFKLHETDYEEGKTFMLENLVTKALFPARPSPRTSTKMLLETLGRTLDEDFLFLLPEEGDKNTDKKETNSESSEGDAKYILEAYVCCCPSGFDPREKLGNRLAKIHGPVPGYPQKLEASMDRFFSRLEVGKYVRRVNWAVTTNTEVYAAGPGTNHAHEGDEVEELEDVDVDKTFLRCERQTLHRLPKSKALVFAFRTYLYPIAQIKEEGKGEELAQAIDGLKEGSVPAMHFYKRGVVWGEAVKRYLRS